MAVNLQTIKDIRNYLRAELDGIYTEEEIRSITHILNYTVLNINKLHFLTENGTLVTPDKVAAITEICRRLINGEPLQYILGETEFYGLRIKVNPHTLIPRPETEEMTDLIIRENRDFKGTIIDIGTGSGCIAIALSASLPGAWVSGFDISGEAVALASENAEINNVKASFFCADILDNINAISCKADIIVSNPPYVRLSEKGSMGKNVLDFEPHNALFVPDNRPLIHYEAILRLAQVILNPGGKVYFEINETMGAELTLLMQSFDYENVTIVTDINGKERILKASRYG